MEFVFDRPHGHIILAVRFGENSERLFKSTQTLCKKTSMNLRLVHVVEEVTPVHYNYQDFPGPYGTVPWRPGAEEKAVLDAEKHMQAIIATKDPKVRVETQILLSSDSSSALISECRNAALLVLGASKRRYGLIPRSVSPFLSVLSYSRIPVLSIRSAQDFDFSKGYRMVIADDLAAGSSTVIATALNFALASGATEIFHAHFLPHYVRNLTSLPHSANKYQNPQSEDFLARLERAVEVTLRGRSRSFEKKLVSSGCRYSTSVLPGDVREGIASLIKGERQAVVALGRPLPSRLRPLGLKRAALEFLWTGNHAILVVPWD